VADHEDDPREDAAGSARRTDARSPSDAVQRRTQARWARRAAAALLASVAMLAA
jgi:hypothetical protein